MFPLILKINILSVVIVFFSFLIFWDIFFFAFDQASQKFVYQSLQLLVLQILYCSYFPFHRSLLLFPIFSISIIHKVDFFFNCWRECLTSKIVVYPVLGNLFFWSQTTLIYCKAKISFCWMNQENKNELEAKILHISSP